MRRALPVKVLIGPAPNRSGPRGRRRLARAQWSGQLPRSWDGFEVDKDLNRLFKEDPARLIKLPTNW